MDLLPEWYSALCVEVLQEEKGEVTRLSWYKFSSVEKPEDRNQPPLQANQGRYLFVLYPRLELHLFLRLISSGRDTGSPVVQVVRKVLESSLAVFVFRIVHVVGNPLLLSGEQDLEDGLALGEAGS